MLEDPNAVTAPLSDFLLAYAKDDTLWWHLAVGHHLNLFEAAVDRMEEAEAELKRRREASEAPAPPKDDAWSAWDEP